MSRYVDDHPAKPGTRWGSITVLCAAGVRVYPAGGAGFGRGWIQRHPRVRVRCDCGRVYDAMASQLVYGRIRQCRYCRGRASALKTSVRLPSGKTIAELARETGIKADTLLHRWLRGWPEGDLALPPDRRARAARPRPHAAQPAR